MSTPTIFDQDALRRIRATIGEDIDAGRYDGAVIAVARHGEIGMHEAIGYADRTTGRTATVDDVFWIFSMTKAFTNILVLQAIDRGQLDLTTRVVDVIPEFVGRDPFRTAAKKDRVNVGHLLTHRAGLVVTPTPLPYSEIGNLDAVIDAISQLDVVGEPGGTFNYSPTLNHALLGEMVRRATGYGSYGELLTNELFAPLKMNDTALGAPKAWADRMVPIKAQLPSRRVAQVLGHRGHAGHRRRGRGDAVGRRGIDHQRHSALRGNDPPRRRTRRGTHPLAEHPRSRHDPADRYGAERSVRHAVPRPRVGRTARELRSGLRIAGRGCVPDLLRGVDQPAHPRQLRRRLHPVLGGPRDRPDLRVPDRRGDGGRRQLSPASSVCRRWLRPPPSERTPT